MRAMFSCGSALYADARVISRKEGMLPDLQGKTRRFPGALGARSLYRGRVQLL